MSQVRVLPLFSLALFVAGTAQAQEVDERDALSHLAPISGPVGTLVRLPLSPEVLEHAAADLSDVRVLDEAGDDLPYAVDREEHRTEAAPIDWREPLEVLWASQTRSRTSAAVVSREVYRVTLPPAELGEGVSLELETTLAAFTATAHVTGVGLDVRATVFRVPEMGVERLDVTLPPGVDGPIELTLESEAGALSPRLFVHVRSVPRWVERLERALEVAGSRVEGTTQVIELVRPPGVVPIELSLRTSSPNFAAPVRVSVRSADAGEREIGGGTLYRVSVAGEVAERLGVAVDGEAAGDRIVLRLERGDSPPLEAVEVVAVLRSVALVFENETGTALHFGGARLRAPDYDIGWLVARLSDPGLPRASLGEVRPSPAYRHEPLLGFAMRAGAEIDRSTFHHAARVTIPDAPEGLTRVELSPALALAAAADLSDVRVVSSDGRQWPYVLAGELRDVIVEVPAERAAHPDRPGWSRYTLRLPSEPFAAVSVAIDPDERFFSRAIEVRGTAGDGTVLELERSYAERTGGEGGPVTVALAGHRVEQLTVDVEDGSEAPLTFGSVAATVRVTDLLVTAPSGEYEILCGDALAEAPTYDLARVPDRLLENVAIAVVTAGALAPNERFHEPTFLERSGWQTVALWVVLVLSVLVLLGMTLRMARSEPEPAAASTAEPTAPAEAPRSTEEPAVPPPAPAEASRPEPSGGDDDE